MNRLRETLAGLTLRGRAFLAAGITTVVCAVLVGQSDLVRVGVLIGVLPLGAVAVLARGTYDLELHRHLEPRVARTGQSVEITLGLRNVGARPTGILRLEEQLPYALGAQPRFVLEGIPRHWRRQVTYRTRSDVRGRFEIGPMQVRIGDPFGLVQISRTFTQTTALLVTPRIVELPPTPLTQAARGSGEHRSRSFATGTADDLTVREYRPGDELRRVHWRSSARRGELMVRREEQPWQANATVLLDTRAGAHHGRAAASSFEAAVSAAASILVHLSQSGYRVRLVTPGETATGALWHDRSSQRDRDALLEYLAVVATGPAVTVDAGWLSGEASIGAVYAVLASPTERDVAALRRIRGQAPSAAALVLDARAWIGAPASDPTAAATRAGWNAVRLGPSDSLEIAWQELGRPRSRRRTVAVDL